MYNREEEIGLWKKWKEQKDSEALTNLLVSLDPLLNKNVNKYKSSSIPIESLQAEARRLAVQGLNTYNPEKAQLNTHITNNLKKLQRFTIKYQNIAQIPESRGLQVSKFISTKTFLTEDLGREPSLAELSDELKWSLPEVERMNNELRKDLTQSEGKEDTFFDYSTTGQETSELKDAIMFVWYDSNDVERKILEYTFGIGGVQRIDSVSQIALMLNKPEHQIRAIRKKLAKKIYEARM